MIIGVVVAALFGLAVGSFLNLCIDRLPDDKSIVHPPSRCDSCGRRLGFRDLVPVLSYLWLRGRCRFCNAEIPIRVPIVEIVTASLFAFMYSEFHESTLELAFSLFFVSALIIIFFTDWEQQLILDVITYPGMAIALAFSFFREDPDELSALAGWAAGFGIMFVLYIIFRGGLGFGDVKLMGLVGLAVGWPLIGVALWLGMVAGGLGAIFLLVAGLKGRKDVIPYGPFLIFGAFITFIWGEPLWDEIVDLFEPKSTT